MSISWTITNPGGSGTSPLADLGLSAPQVNFRILGVSKATVAAHRDYDSADGWWAPDEVVTIYRDGQPFFTGRVQESPQAANAESERRTLSLADAWRDLEEVIYQEEWAIGSGAALYPRVILGKNAAGADITTGAQIGAAIDYAISQGVEITKGTIAEGFLLWPSEARNMSCEAVIVAQMRFHPDWAAWLDHSTVPPTFHARPKSALDAVTLDIADAEVESFNFAEVVRNVPRGVRIVYESAAVIDGEVYRSNYEDTAGETTGRKIQTVMLDLEGMQMQRQKARVKTRDIPDEGNDEEAITEQKNFLIANFPQLATLTAEAWTVRNFKTVLVPDAGGHPPAISPKALRLIPNTKADVPRQLVNGQIEDWMRKKVGQVSITYDLDPVDTGAIIVGPINTVVGKNLSFTITATNATSRRYRGVSSFTAGEGRPEGLAAALFAAATEQQHEGGVTVVSEDVAGGRFHGKKIILMDGVTVVMPATVIHSASHDIERGATALEFGPLPYLTAGDALELQRLFNRRKPTWMSSAERTSNTLGSEESASAAGDTVTGYDIPQTIISPGGGATEIPFAVRLITTAGEEEAPDTYEVTVGWGHVNEKRTGAGNATPEPWAAENMFDEEDEDQLRRFEIEIGQAVYVQVEVDSAGNIAAPASESEEEPPAVSIVILADEQESVHYIPVVDTDTGGSAGTMYYKLAVLKAPVEPATTPTLEKWLTGSHIDHVPPLPSMLSTISAGTDIGRIPKEWNNSSKAYRLRGLQGLCGIKLTETSDRIEIRPGGDTFRVRLWQTNFFLDYLGTYLDVDNGESPVQEFWVLKGIWYTTEPETWTDCGGGSESPVYDVSYSVPTVSYGS